MSRGVLRLRGLGGSGEGEGKEETAGTLQHEVLLSGWTILWPSSKYTLCGHGSLVAACDPLSLLQSRARGDLMTNLSGVVRILKKEHDRLTREVRAVAAALSAFGTTYAKQNEARGSISVAGRARIAAAPESAMGESEGEERQT